MLCAESQRIDLAHALVAAVLAKKAGKPVKLINTREEEFLAGCRPRVFMKINVKMGFKKDGRIRAKELKVIADNGAYSAKAPAITGVAAMRHDTAAGAVLTTVEWADGTRSLTYRRQFDLKQRELGKQQYPMVQALFARAEKSDAEVLVLLRR